jgi:hypothetical protein
MIPRSALGFTEWLENGLRCRADGAARAFCVPAIAGLLIALPALAAAQVPVSARLASRAAESGRVKVLVQLDVPFTAEDRLSAAARQDQRAAIATAQDAVAATLDGSSIKAYSGIPWMAADVTAAQLRALAAHPGVIAIDEDVLLRPALADSTTRINAHLIWQAGYEGAGWSVAVLDSGTESGHPFLVGKVNTEACFSTTFAGSPASTSLCPGQVGSSTAPGSGAACASTTAGCDHGTHVAGIAVGRLNATGQFGVGRGANLIPIQVFSQFTDTGTCSPDPAPCALAYSSDVIAGLNHVGVLAGAGNSGRVAAANLSLGSGSFSAVCDTTTGMPPVKAAIDALASLGIATVVAAGNSGSSTRISAPGLSNLGIFAVGPARAFASLAPNGIYYVRVRAQNAFGTGPPSPEVVVVVGVGFTGTLMPPRDFRSSFDGRVLSLNWNIETNAATPESYVIDLGTAPGQSNLGSYDLYSNQMSVSATNVLPGVYYARLRARIGQVLSAFSNEVNFVISSAPPCQAAPFAPSTLRANLVGNVLSLSWVPPLLSGFISSYVIEVGTSPGQANILNFNTGSPVVIYTTPAPSGLYWVRVRAVNACGVSLPSGEILVTVP